VAKPGAPPQTGTQLGTLSLPVGQGLLPERLGASGYIFFYFIAG
jgi:hypothetical protein